MKTRTLLHRCSLLIAIFVFGSSLQAQDRSQRNSPPQQAMASIMGHDVIITYSSPSKNDRHIFGGLVPYGEVWRTGANEATTLSIASDMKIEGYLIKAGKYGLFTIPGEESWEIIINEVWDQWGAYNYDADKDVARFAAQVRSSDKVVEDFTIDVNDGGEVKMMWDQTIVTWQIE